RYVRWPPRWIRSRTTRPGSEWIPVRYSSQEHLAPPCRHSCPYRHSCEGRRSYSTAKLVNALQLFNDEAGHPFGLSQQRHAIPAFAGMTSKTSPDRHSGEGRNRTSSTKPTIPSKSLRQRMAPQLG